MKIKIASVLVAITAVISGQAAMAQKQCVATDDLADTVTYAMPMLYEAIRGPCSSIFARSPFMANEAGAFIDQFRMRQDASWPGTLRLLKVFMSANAEEDGGANAMAQAITQLPEDALRPLADMILIELMNERLTKDIKVSTCADIAQAMELIAPLPVDNITGLTVFLAKQAELNDPPICGVDLSTSAE